MQTNGFDSSSSNYKSLLPRHSQELKDGVVPLLIPTPNALNDIGYNRDRFIFNPSSTDEESIAMFKFLGILFGVAVRTKKPLDLYLAPPVWKQLAGMTLTSDDLEEVNTYLSNLRDLVSIEYSELQTGLYPIFCIANWFDLNLLFLSKVVFRVT